MSEKPEGLNTPSHGNKQTWAIIFFLTSFFWQISYSQTNHLYYVCSYENDIWNTNILVATINLDSKRISNSTSIPIRGELAFKKPLILSRDNQMFYIIITDDGLPAKDAELMNIETVRFAVCDPSLNLLYLAELPGLTILDSYRDNNATGLKFTMRRGNSLLDYKGNIIIQDSNRIDIVNQEPDIYDHSNYPVIGGFKYFEKIKETNDRIYWNTTNNGRYLLSLDIGNNRLIDSLNIESDKPYFNLFGMSDNDSLIYVFYMNSNNLSGPTDLLKTEIDPSYLKILRSADFSIIDSIDIHYPPLDSGYAGGDTGPCDKVGPFFVYFDLNGESYGCFSPAMLFIFDTRTNEASWLRVGWR